MTLETIIILLTVVLAVIFIQTPHPKKKKSGSEDKDN